MSKPDAYLDAGLRGYIANEAAKNVGRIANYDFDDLVQEGYMIFYKCRGRYVGRRGLIKKDGTPCRYLPPVHPDKEALKHFMALFKTAYANRLSTLAWKQPAGWEIPISATVGAEQTLEAAWESVLPSEEETASAAALLASAPAEIKQLFSLLIDDAIQLSGYRRFGRGKRARRETNNQYFTRLLGLPAHHDIVGQIQAHFLGR